MIGIGSAYANTLPTAYLYLCYNIYYVKQNYK